MSQHTSDVFAKTILIPGLLLGLLTFGGYYAFGKFKETDDLRIKTYGEHTKRVTEVQIATTALKPYGNKLKEWEKIASNDTRSAIDTSIRNITQELDRSKIIVTETKDDISSPLGADKKLENGMTMRSYTQRWEGTYKELGKLLVRLEERNPVLHLTEINLTPSRTAILQGKTLSMGVTWGAWEGPYKINQSYGTDQVITRADQPEEKSAENEKDEN